MNGSIETNRRWPESGATRRARRRADGILRWSILVALTVLSAPWSAGHVAAQEPEADSMSTRIEAELLRRDVRQLAGLLEASHPDPYLRGGGKVAFHRRLHQVLAAIPGEGMTIDEFLLVVQPFVAAIRDGHTDVFIRREGGAAPRRLPLGFRVLGNSLIVDRIHDAGHRSLIGARLVTVEGVPFGELVERQASRRGYDNVYHNLLHLQNDLRRARTLAALVPEWDGSAALDIELETHDGAIRHVQLPLESELPEPIELSSRIKLPSTERSAQAFAFLDDTRRTMLLRIDTMMGYREAFENNLSRGYKGALRSADEIYERYHGSEPPDDPERLVAGLPSATDLFRDMVIAMQAAGTRTLVIDLRRNHGGNSSISSILLYFLYGKRAIVMRDRGYQIKKYSDLYFDNYTNVTLESLNDGRDLPLTRQDYSFSSETAYREEQRALAAGEVTDADIQEAIDAYGRYYERMPTFHAEYRSGRYEAHYRPEHVMILCSAETRSAAFDLLVDLYRLGAVIVGTPSSQTGNCFIDSIGFELTHSGLRGAMSYKDSLLFPDDPELGEVLPPDEFLTYERLAGYGFDPNAEVLLALEAVARTDDGR